jgi:hypothetical protein
MQKGGAAQHPGWSLWALSQALKMDARDRMTTLGRIPKICYWTALSPLISFPAQKFSLTFFFMGGGVCEGVMGGWVVWVRWVTHRFSGWYVGPGLSLWFFRLLF